MSDDYRNGHVALPEVDRLMMRLLQRVEADYHPTSPTGEYMVPLRKWVKNKISVFPGGNGVLGDAFPVGGIMALANDFDALHHYELGVTEGYGNGGQVIESLLQKMCEEISPSLLREVWFTNFCQGVRVAEDQYGVCPGWRYEPYREFCREFFLHSLTIQQPRLIIALGKHVPKYLATTSRDLATWSRSDFNDRGVTGVTFHNSYRCKVISIIHPAMRHLNVPRRKYAGLTGHAAEMQLLRDALLSTPS